MNFHAAWARLTDGKRIRRAAWADPGPLFVIPQTCAVFRQAGVHGYTVDIRPYLSCEADRTAEDWEVVAE